MVPALSQILEPICRSAAAIETAFLKASEGLGRGLDAFDQLNVAMTGLARELDSGSIGTAAASLDGLCHDLRAIGTQLPEDVTTLEALVVESEAITARLDRLLDHIRMVTVISRAARIEAIVFDSQALGLQDFTQQITAMASRIRDDVEACTRTHSQMVELLKGALQSQTDLDRHYRDRLATLVGELGETFSAIRHRGEQSSAFLRDVTGRFAHIARATGSALMSLQSGDSLRQRLEHVRDGVDRILALNDGDLGADPTIPESARDSTVMVLCRLQNAQITDAVSAFEAEADSVHGSLRDLTDEIKQLIGSTDGVFGDPGNREESFLHGFRTRLTHATDLVERCEAARSSIAIVTNDLQAMLADFDGKIAALNDITSSIVIVGMNASLKATRLGPAGRSLVVVSEELRRLAVAIADDSKELLSLFRRVRDRATFIGRLSSPKASNATSIDGAVLSIVRDLDAGSRRLDACLSLLHAEGRTFDAELGRATLEFSDAVSMNGALLDVADLLQQAAGAASNPRLDASCGTAFATAIMERRYTMAREREIHAEVLALPIAC